MNCHPHGRACTIVVHWVLFKKMSRDVEWKNALNPSFLFHRCFYMAPIHTRLRNITETQVRRSKTQVIKNQPSKMP